MNYTDGILFGLFFLFFCQGWQKGLFRAILGPFSLLLGLIASYIYYLKTEDLLVSLAVSIFAPFILHFLLALFSKFSRPTGKDGKPASPAFVSSLLGGFFSLIWQGPILLLLAFFIVLIPGKISWIRPVQLNIQRSLTYETINGWTGNQLPQEGLNFKTLREIMQDPKTVQEVEDTDAYKNVMANPKIQALLKDEAIQKDIEAQNILSLMKNAKVQGLMVDKDLLKNMFALQEEILKHSAKK